MIILISGSDFPLNHLIWALTCLLKDFDGKCSVHFFLGSVLHLVHFFVIYYMVNIDENAHVFGIDLQIWVLKGMAPVIWLEWKLVQATSIL